MESLTLSNSMDSYNDAIVDLTYSNNFYFLAGSIRENNRYKSVIYRSSDLTTRRRFIQLITIITMMAQKESMFLAT